MLQHEMADPWAGFWHWPCYLRQVVPLRRFALIPLRIAEPQQVLLNEKEKGTN